MSGNSELLDVDNALEAAAELGLIAIFPLGDELILDIDQPFESAFYSNGKMFAVMASNGIKVQSMLHTKSKSGNSHVYIKLEQLISHKDRIILQAVLGSDPTREFLSLLRQRKGFMWPTVAFETTEEAARVEEWRQENIRHMDRINWDIMNDNSVAH